MHKTPSLTPKELRPATREAEQPPGKEPPSSEKKKNRNERDSLLAGATVDWREAVGAGSFTFIFFPSQADDRHKRNAGLYCVPALNTPFIAVAVVLDTPINNEWEISIIQICLHFPTVT